MNRLINFLILIGLVIITTLTTLSFINHKKASKIKKNFDYELTCKIKGKSFERVGIVTPSSSISPFNTLIQGFLYNNYASSSNAYRIIVYSLKFEENFTDTLLRNESRNILKKIKNDNIKYLFILGNTADTYIGRVIQDKNIVKKILVNTYDEYNSYDNTFYDRIIITDRENEDKEKSALELLDEVLENNFINFVNVCLITESVSYRIRAEDNEIKNIKKFFSTKKNFPVEEYEVTNDDEIKDVVEKINNENGRSLIIVTCRKYLNLADRKVYLREDASKLVYKLIRRSIVFSKDYQFVKNGQAHISLGVNYFNVGYELPNLIKDTNYSMTNINYIVSLSIKGLLRFNARNIYTTDPKIVKFIGE